jgi:hypothetical protein
MEICLLRLLADWRKSANNCAISEKRASTAREKDQESGSQKLSPETWCLCQGIYYHSEKAELGLEEGSEGKAYKWYGGHRIHPGCWTQSPGAFHCVDQGRQGKGFAGREISYSQGRPGLRRCGQSQAEQVQVWRKAPEIII